MRWRSCVADHFGGRCSSAVGEYLHVRHDEHPVRCIGPPQESLCDLLQLFGRAEPVLDGLFGEAGEADPISPQPAPPVP